MNFLILMINVRIIAHEMNVTYYLYYLKYYLHVIQTIYCSKYIL